METLNEKQRNVLEFILNGKNAFITGFAGSGKSYLIEYLRKTLKQQKKRVALTAMTGCAALLINGKTLHSELGIGLAKGEPRDLLKRIRRTEGMFEHLFYLDCLIIDEVSMLSDLLFDKINALFKLIKHKETPFGGLQVILVGDMSQLKPVEGEYCFFGFTWDSCQFTICVLTENMRVQNDQRFHDLLTKFRWGKLSDLELIEQMKQNDFSSLKVKPTKLFSKNKDVDALNQYELGLLLQTGREVVSFKVLYTENPLKLKVSTKYVSDAKIPEFLQLCIGAQVMVTRNLSFEEGIINGTRGIVVSISKTGVIIQLLNGNFFTVSYFHVKPEGEEDDIYLDFKYIPLILSWAVSIHKSQGATIDCLEVDLGESIFACGQAYTALSRARSSSSVKITSFNPKSIKVSKSVIHFYTKYT
jgi:ATP-dependent DNA helicase PIF1